MAFRPLFAGILAIPHLDLILNSHFQLNWQLKQQIKWGLKGVKQMLGSQKHNSPQKIQYYEAEIDTNQVWREIKLNE